MLYLVIERFQNGNPQPIYERFAEQGRLAPEGLTYVNSWVTEDLSTCYQIMQTHNYVLLEQWMANWQDLVDFEVLPVLTSAEAKSKILGNS
jgi:hypothetical protein